VADTWQLVTITTDTAINANQLYVGRVGANYFDGTIDEVRLYNRVLQPTEVQQLYHWAPGPVGYWPMDEGTGTTSTADRSGNDHPATFTSIAETDWVPGKFGSALQFDGVNDIISAGDQSIYDFGTSSFTYMGWFKINSSQPGFIPKLLIKGLGTAGQKGYELNINPSSNVLTASFTYDTSNNKESVSFDFDTESFYDVWAHYAVVHDRSGDMVLYINGVEKSRTSIAARSTRDISNTDDFTIAGRGVNLLKTLVDEVKLYNYARTPSQVIEDMNASHPMGGSPISSKYLHYQFDEGSGTTANNSGFGSGINGTISSGTWTTSGKYDKALTFTASSSVTATITDPGYNNTISLWVYPTTSAASKTLVTSGKLTTNASSQPVYGGCTGSALSINTWTHITAVSNGSGSCAIYQNGVLTDSDTTGVTFGTSVNIGGSSFTGTIDDVKLYNTPLTTDQVLLDFNAGSGINLGTGTNQRANLTDGDYTSSLVGYWPLNENTGTSTTYDKSTNSYDLTLTSIDEADWMPGKYGSALDFDGSADYATSTPENGNFSINSYSVTAWIYRQTDTGGIEAIVDNRDADNDGWSMFVDASDKLSCSYNSTDSVSTTSIALNTWYHVACTSNGSTMSLHLNGISEDSDAITGSISETTDIRIATQSYGTSQKFSGLVDDVKVFSSTLTPSQIAYEYNRGAPVAWWRFDECQGATANDASGNGLNGTITIGGTGTYTSPGTCGSGTSTHAWNAGTTGRFGASLGFDDLNDYVTVSDANALDLTNSLSISAWVKPDANEADNVVVSKGTSYEVGTNADGDIYWYNGSTTNDDASAKITAGTWNHIVVTNNDTTVTYYLNGVATGTDTAGIGANNATALYLGYDGTNYFDGLIDDVRIYNYPLSTTQVKQILTGGAVRFE
jgi:hypothetical protein